MCAASTEPRWLPIESNPEVMTKFLRACGMESSWAVCDVFGLDEALLAMIPQPTAALLLLFPMSKKYSEYCESAEKSIAECKDKLPSDLYYMKQTISNACGTVALIHAVANNMDKVAMGDGSLKTFLEATKDATPEERAVKLEADDSICKNHDDVARQGQTATPGENDEVEYHFISFVEKDGRLFEMDGRKSGPLDCGSTDNFLFSAAEECKKYMARDPDNINFTVVALAPAEQ